MSNPEWGVKRLCQNCGTKFYDLKRTLVSCPSCGAEVERDSPLKTRRTRGAAPKPAPVEAPKKPQKPRAVEADDDGEDVEDLADTDLGDADVDDDLGDEADDDLIEDTSELGDDDVSDVVSSSDNDDDER